MLRFLPDDVKGKAKHVYGNDSSRSLLKAWCTDGTPAMVFYRLMQSSDRLRLTPLTFLFNKMNAIFGRCIIGRGAQFGEEFVIVHSHGVVINSSVRGGKGIVIEHQVTIGEEKGKSPVLGDHVFIGAGAKLIGGITVGNNTKIGANAVVNCDVPDGATAVGVPARIIPADTDENISS